MPEQTRTFKWWYFILGALLILILGSTQLPNEYSLKREAVYKLDKDCVLELAGDFNRWIQWYYPNPEGVDSLPTAVFFGEAMKPGHEMWVPYRGDTVIHQILAISENEIRFKVFLVKGDEELTGSLNMEDMGNGKIKITREETARIGLRPLQRYLNLFMEINSKKATDMENSLQRINKYCNP